MSKCEITGLSTNTDRVLLSNYLYCLPYFCSLVGCCISVVVENGEGVWTNPQHGGINGPSWSESCLLFSCERTTLSEGVSVRLYVCPSVVPSVGEKRNFLSGQ